jgi:hypothetical protein
MPCSRLDTATFKCGIIRWKIGFSPGEMTVVIAVGSVSRTTAESTKSSQSVILVVRHVTAGVSRAGKDNAGPASCDKEMLAGDRVGDEPADGCADQTCSKCSPGVSDTVGEQVRRPVGVYECGVLQ